MARTIDAEKYMELLKEQYLHHKSMGDSKEARAWQGAMQLLYDMPTLTSPNEWVRVDKRLPEDGERVIATDGCFTGEAYIDCYGVWCRSNGMRWNMFKTVVTHWMPLPAPPAKDENNT